MANYQQQQARLLEQYCDALAENPQALPPAELDAAFVSLAQRLYQQAGAAKPSSTFAWRLEQRLATSPTATADSRTNPAARSIPAASRHFPLQSWLMPHLATALMLALLVVGAALLAGILSGRNPAVGSGNTSLASPTPQLPSIDTIRGNASKALESGQIQSFVLTETTRAGTDNSHFGNLIDKPITAPVGGDVTGERTIVFQTPNLWRIESKGVLSSSPKDTFEKLQTVEVSDGTSLWRYDGGSNTVSFGFNILDSVKGGPHPLEDVLGQGYSLSWLTGNCYQPSVSGVDTVAGRPVYVIDLGGYRCFGLATSFPRAIWIDQQTYFVLGIATYYNLGQGFGVTEATNVQYNVPIALATFTFTPPPGAKYEFGSMDIKPEEVLLQKLMPQIFQAVAIQLGISEEELKSDLAKNLAISDIAKSKGADEQGLKGAIIKAIKPGLDQQVTSGSLSQDLENKVIQIIQTSYLSRMLLVNTQFPKPTPSGTSQP